MEMGGGWVTLTEWLSEQSSANTKRAAVLVEEERSLPWTSTVGATCGPVRCVNPVASRTLEVGPRDLLYVCMYVCMYVCISSLEDMLIHVRERDGGEKH